MTDEADFRSLLSRVDQWLAEHRPEFHAGLRPGATTDQLRDFEARFGIALPTTFKIIYGWHDGQEESCTASLQRNRMFMSLGDIASTKEMLDGMIETDFDDPEWWQTSWVPFLANGGGDYLCVDVNDGRIVAFWHADGDRKAVHSGLEDWLRGLHTSMADGTYRVV